MAGTIVDEPCPTDARLAVNSPSLVIWGVLLGEGQNGSWILWETPVWCTATAVALRVAARQRGACFEASHQRQNELTKQHTKQTAADH
eukprot:6213740-Pleurochrysis_carterae.AAC.4